jgi:hypothetical protein
LGDHKQSNQQDFEYERVHASPPLFDEVMSQASPKRVEASLLVYEEMYYKTAV